jgi:hypothetical protein
MTKFSQVIKFLFRASSSLSAIALQGAYVWGAALHSSWIAGNIKREISPGYETL